MHAVFIFFSKVVYFFFSVQVFYLFLWLWVFFLSVKKIQQSLLVFYVAHMQHVNTYC